EKLKADGVMDEESIKAMDAEVVAEVEDAYQFADESPDPEPGELYTDVYAPVGGERGIA
ncbi:MAG: thiamine pyrophosphate-dependent enzyme, partial [Gemmatimonadota bacterium]